MKLKYPPKFSLLIRGLVYSSRRLGKWQVRMLKMRSISQSISR